MRTTGPESRGFQENFRAGVDHEEVVACRLPVLPDRIGDVGGDMLLLRPAEHLDQVTIGADELLGGGLFAGIGRLPGVHGAAPAHPDGLGTRAWQGVIAVHEQGPSRLGPGRDVERQHIDFGVPEHVPEIGVAGQRAGPDGDAFVGRIGRAVQMVDRKPQCPFGSAVTRDLEVAEAPAFGPGSLMFGEHATPADPLRSIERVACFPTGIPGRTVAPRHGDQALEGCGLTRHRGPIPGPSERGQRPRRQLGIVQLQRGGAGHRQALAGLLGAPHAEVLLKTYRIEPGTHLVESRVYRDLGVGPAPSPGGQAAGPECDRPAIQGGALSL